MDPFSSDGELVNIHTAFVQGQYQQVLTDHEISTFSPSNHLAVQILQCRAQCALSQYDEATTNISDSDAKSIPDLAAVRVYARYLQKPSDAATAEAERLAEQYSDNLTVQLLCGIILTRADKQDAAIALLSKHQGSLDAVALIIQIHLQQNRLDLAQQQAKSARSFAQDALLVNLAESWIGMRRGGEEYQKAFYVFEEMAQNPSSSSALSLIAQAVSEIHLGRTEEAEAALKRAAALEPDNADIWANQLVLDTIAGRDGAEARARLQSMHKEHDILADLAVKRDAFQAAMAKYSPKFEP